MRKVPVRRVGRQIHRAQCSCRGPNAASLDREHWVHQAIQQPDREYWKKPYPTDLVPDAKHQTWPQASDDQAKKMEEQKHQESYNFKRAKLNLQNTMRKAEAEYRTCWRCGHPITQVWWTTLLVSEAVLSRRPTCSSFCLLEYCSTIGNNWLLEVSLDKDEMMCQLDKLQKELLPPAT